MNEVHCSSSMQGLVALLAILCLSASAKATHVTEAMAALHEFETACRQARSLWPVELCGPLVLVHPETRVAVANRPDPDDAFEEHDGMFVGQWPADLGVANTALYWGDRKWAMVMLPLSNERFSRLRLLAHESFHRIQPELGFEQSDPIATHLDEMEGRLWLRLEIRALASAIAGGDDEARSAVRDALHFRRQRHAAYPGAAEVERQLEAHEGLAEYTGVRFALDVEGADVAAIAALVEGFEARPTYVRSLGYGTGPAIGLLLDRYEPDWRQDVSATPDLARLLAVALGGATLGQQDLLDRDGVMRRAKRYGARAILAEEEARAERLARQRTHYREALVEGPVLVLELPERRLLFNPNTVLSLGEAGNVYPQSTLIGPWGRLRLDEGAALATPERDRAWVVAPESSSSDEGGIIDGPGWSLETAAGWRLVPGGRPGDFRLEKLQSDAQDSRP